VDLMVKPMSGDTGDGIITAPDAPAVTTGAQDSTATETAQLEVDDVSVRFGGVHALTDVSFTLSKGVLGAVIGPNGAGKTTLFNCITGIYRPTSGEIRFEGQAVNKLAQHKVARLGIARTFQNLALFSGMTVIDNLMLGRYLHGRRGLLAGAFFWPVVRDEVRQRERVEHIIDMLEINPYRNTYVKDLAYGLQKRVEFGRALAQEGRLLLLDEPMAGMTSEEKEDMARFILDVRAELGTTMLLVEHDMGVVMDIAEQICVFDFGVKIAEGTPQQIQRDDRVIAAYLGDKKKLADVAVDEEDEAAAALLTG
jgi:branched-chain amino acid transport system ATP-binding protein